MAENSFILVKIETTFLVCNWIFKGPETHTFIYAAWEFVMNHRDIGQCWKSKCMVIRDRGHKIQPLSEEIVSAFLVKES